MIRPPKKNRPAAAAGDAFAIARRGLLKIIPAVLLAPLWTFACRGEDRLDRQGADQMQPTEQGTDIKSTSPRRPLPILDGRIPEDVQTATFAMG